MKKILTIVTILTVLIVGCGNEENIETEKTKGRKQERKLQYQNCMIGNRRRLKI